MDSANNGGTPSDTIGVDLEYPRSEDRPRYVEIELTDVRCADNLRISYDFDEDGWRVEQPRDIDNFDDQGWCEVGFFPAWGMDSRLESNRSDPPPLDPLKASTDELYKAIRRGGQTAWEAAGIKVRRCEDQYRGALAAILGITKEEAEKIVDRHVINGTAERKEGG